MNITKCKKADKVYDGGISFCEGCTNEIGGKEEEVWWCDKCGDSFCNKCSERNKPKYIASFKQKLETKKANWKIDKIIEYFNVKTGLWVWGMIIYFMNN